MNRTTEDIAAPVLPAIMKHYKDIRLNIGILFVNKIALSLAISQDIELFIVGLCLPVLLNKYQISPKSTCAYLYSVQKVIITRKHATQKRQSYTSVVYLKTLPSSHDHPVWYLGLPKYNITAQGSTEKVQNKIKNSKIKI